MKGIIFCIAATASLIGPVANTANAQLLAGDCQKVKLGQGLLPNNIVKELAEAKIPACDWKGFWDITNDPKYLNADDPASAKNLPVCMGFNGAINDYIRDNPNKCRRLASSKWTPSLNMFFVECIGQGKISSGKVIWVTKPAEIAYRKSWETFVTIKEMCLLQKLKGGLLQSGQSLIKKDALQSNTKTNTKTISNTKTVTKANTEVKKSESDETKKQVDSGDDLPSTSQVLKNASKRSLELVRQKNPVVQKPLVRKPAFRKPVTKDE